MVVFMLQILETAERQECEIISIDKTGKAVEFNCLRNWSVNNFFSEKKVNLV